MTDLTELKQQIELLCIERGLDIDEVVRAIEAAIASAYRREFGQKELSYEAKFDIETGKYSVFRTTQVVDEVKNEGREISLVEARLTNPKAQLGDVITEKLIDEADVNFGRIASQVAKQVLFQAINNARHTKILQQFKDKVGDVVSVEVDFYRKGGYLVKLAQTTGFISRENLLPIDKFRPGQIIKALIVDISEDERGNSRIVLSRTSPDFVKAIIANEVPEVSAGMVIINKIVREPGSRSKVLVSVAEEERAIDPVGTILGRKNVRIVNIMREISTAMQEKIDIIEYRPEDIEAMIMDALEPAEVERVEVNEANKTADVYCYPDEASLAVGRRGVNIRLASELVGYTLNLKTVEVNETQLDSDSPLIISDDDSSRE
jgi:N utilization substance protein A